MPLQLGAKLKELSAQSLPSTTATLLHTESLSELRVRVREEADVAILGTEAARSWMSSPTPPLAS